MPFTTMDQDEAVQFFKDVIRGLIPGADLSDGSDYDVIGRAVAAIFTGNQAQAEYLLRQIFPTTAESEFLQRHLRIRNIPLQAPAGAVGTAMLTGDAAGPTLTAGSKLTHADGTEYEVTQAASLTQPSWPGAKQATTGSSVKRLLVSPNTNGIVEGQVVGVNLGTVEKRVVKAVISGLAAIDLEEPLSSAPSAGAALTSEIGAACSISATGTGAATNKTPGDTLTIESPPANMHAAARVQSLAGGGDQETEEEGRARAADFEANHADSGNMAHYRKWARETPGLRLTDAVIFPGLYHAGAHLVIPIGVRGARIVNDKVSAAVAQYVGTQAPWMDNPFVDEMSFGSVVDVSIDVRPEVGFEADWGTGVASSFTVAASSTVSQVKLTTDPRTIIEIGDRITVPLQIAGQWRLYQREVSVVRSDSVDIAQDLPAAPVAGELVRPGGPLVQPIIEALETVFEDLGPGVVDANGVSHVRHPSPGDAWDDTLRIARIVTAVMPPSIPGVDNVTVVSPATDQQPLVATVLRLGKITLRFEAI